MSTSGENWLAGHVDPTMSGALGHGDWLIAGILFAGDLDARPQLPRNTHSSHRESAALSPPAGVDGVVGGFRG
jgi:hypothetical protein